MGPPCVSVCLCFFSYKEYAFEGEAWLVGAIGGGNIGCEGFMNWDGMWQQPSAHTIFTAKSNPPRFLF